MELVLLRWHKTPTVTMGTCHCVSEETDTVFGVMTLELPWKNNEKSVSCIPPGTYDVEAITRASKGDYAIWVKDVPGRSEVLVHKGNSTSDIRGCILFGLDADLQKERVGQSVAAMTKIESMFPVGTKGTLEIRESYND
jgi:hypothetical protein